MLRAVARTGVAIAIQSVPVPVAGAPERTLLIPASSTASARASVAICTASTIAARVSGRFTMTMRLIVPAWVERTVARSPARSALENPAVHHAPTLTPSRAATA